MIPDVKLFNVAPNIPDKLRFLEVLSYNMWWSWNHDAIDLFRRINPQLWRQVHGNTRLFLSRVPQARLEELAKDRSFLSSLKRVKYFFEKHENCLTAPTPENLARRKIAYFSLEYGIHESVRLYSGGLGVLSGDHLKAASDQKLPLVAVGLLYGQGYFKQSLDRNGWQQERYPENEIHNMPLVQALDNKGEPVTVKVLLLEREVTVAIWILNVGNIPLILLDTNIPENPPDFQQITWRLYGGDKKMRLHQELLLGIGGFKALIAMGYDPSVCHMNEGHAAFLSLERISYLNKQKGIEFDAAVETVWNSNIFTTHTPVPAGNEVFDLALLRPYLKALEKDMGFDTERVISWGQPVEGPRGNELSMTILGLRMAMFSNGVSKLHGEVAREMWSFLWPGRPIDELPIEHITNGVHVDSWVADRNEAMFDHYLSDDWMEAVDSPTFGEMIKNIPNEELWHSREMLRSRLIRHARVRLQRQMRGRSMPSKEILTSKNVLDADVLTIGFARRFATYKRATMLFSDIDRLKSLVLNEERPVQLIFAGKAHPADDGGKKLIQEIVRAANDSQFRNRIVFLEDYDIALGRELTQGVDVWLNTPLRPHEASGTSGMKAAINGVLNCSILDGWWCEGYSPDCGWVIESDEMCPDEEERELYESQSLYNLIENEIIPAFYERGDDEYPRRWVNMMKASINMGLGFFSSGRMVREYNEKFYEPAIANYERIISDNAAEAMEMVKEKARYNEQRESISIESPAIHREISDVYVDEEIKASTEVNLGELSPDEVEVQVYFGPVDIHNQIVKSNTENMTMTEDLGGGRFKYEHTFTCNQAGRFGMTARIIPSKYNLGRRIPGFVCWAKG